MPIGHLLTHKVKVSLLGLGFLLCVPTMSWAGEFVGGTEPKLQGQELLQALKQGGYIIYFRHGATTKTGEKSVDKKDMDNCAIQRVLSPEGRAQTKAIGTALKRHHILVGNVYTSPYCRCVDSANNIFGKSKKADALYFAIHTNEAQREKSTKQLLDMLATPPQAGMNTGLVSHTANLMGAVKIFPRPEGVAHIFKPEKGGKFSYVGVMQPEAWSEGETLVAASDESKGIIHEWFSSINQWVRNLF